MTVSPTIATRTRRTVRVDRIVPRLADGAVALVAFALLAGVWLAYFTVVPLDFTVR